MRKGVFIFHTPPHLVPIESVFIFFILFLIINEI